MEALLQSVVDLLLAAWQVLIALLAVMAPWTPLVAWVAFWLLAVDWVKLRRVLVSGGWIGLVLIGLVAALAWGVAAPPADGVHRLLGLTVGNFVGKVVYVTALMVLMLICGSVQLAGGCGSWTVFPKDSPEDDHGHDVHADHGASHVAVHSH